jgi:hypothetical protein
VLAAELLAELRHPVRCQFVFQSVHDLISHGLFPLGHSD